MISCAGIVFTLLITAKISRVLCSTLEAIILVCVKYYYVAGEYDLLLVFFLYKHYSNLWKRIIRFWCYYVGKQSYRWWQTKIAKCLVIIYIIAFVCTVIAIESGRLISNNLDCASLSQVSVYQKRTNIDVIIKIICFRIDWLCTD